jgi:hypothetical protein
MTNNLGLKILSLVLATLLWAYVHFIESASLYGGISR